MARRNVGAHHRLHHIGKPDTGARQIERIHRIVDHRITGCRVNVIAPSQKHRHGTGFEVHIWLTMPPQPYEYRGGEAIARFIARERGDRRGANLRLVSTRANGQPAFGCYLPDLHAPIVRAYAMMVLTLREDRVSAVTWFGERSLFAHFGLPRTLPE